MKVRFAVLRESYDDDELTQHFAPVIKMKRREMLVLDRCNLILIPYGEEFHDEGDDEPYTRDAHVAVVREDDWQEMVHHHGTGTILSRRAVAMMDPYRDVSGE